MANLREVVLGLGHTEAATYFQSGNVVVTSKEADTATIAAALERAIAEHLGVQPKVIVPTRAELAQVVADNPFPDEPNPRWVHAIFRNGPLPPDGLAAVAANQQRAQDQGSDDEARVVGSTLFLHTPGGLGRSELAAQLTTSVISQAQNRSSGTPSSRRASSWSLTAACALPMLLSAAASMMLMVAWPRSYWIRSRERASPGFGAMRAIVAAEPAT